MTTVRAMRTVPQPLPPMVASLIEAVQSHGPQGANMDMIPGRTSAEIEMHIQAYPDLLYEEAREAGAGVAAGKRRTAPRNPLALLTVLKAGESVLQTLY